MGKNLSREYELEERGWGPCFHSEEEARKIQDWIDHLCPPINAIGRGGQMEDLVWLIDLNYNGTTKLYCDMWVGVEVIGELYKTDEKTGIILGPERWRYRVFLESDTLLAGVAGCFAWLKIKQTEINLGLHDEKLLPDHSETGDHSVVNK